MDYRRQPVSPAALLILLIAIILAYNWYRWQAEQAAAQTAGKRIRLEQEHQAAAA
jgi:hypothetical protein